MRIQDRQQQYDAGYAAGLACEHLADDQNDPDWLDGYTDGLIEGMQGW